jgi:hypothetical protein
VSGVVLKSHSGENFSSDAVFQSVHSFLSPFCKISNTCHIASRLWHERDCGLLDPDDARCALGSCLVIDLGLFPCSRPTNC